jgi:glycosyltransferase involved in cell wall biosynthesis
MVDFSIITVAKNAEKFIGNNIVSVLNQNFKNFEQLIILNEDDTETKKEIIKILDDRIKLFIVDDEGPYDAMNFGAHKARGKFITFLNSDDYFYNNSVLDEVKKELDQHPTTDYFYGNIVINKNEKILRKWKSGNFKRKKFFFGWHPPHPSLFMRKKDLNFSENIFDKNFNISADYEFMVRYFVKKRKIARFIDKTMVIMRHGGLSSKNLKNIMISNFECCLAWQKNNYYFMFYIFVLKPLKKITQLIFR